MLTNALLDTHHGVTRYDRATSSGIPLRILLVDDDPVIRDCFPAYFATTSDLTVAGIADGGLSAQEWLEENRCEIVLSDIQMPDVDGIALLQWTKQLPQPPLFIAMTAFDTDRNLIAALAEGAAGYVVKKSETPRDHRGNSSCSTRQFEHLRSKRATIIGSPPASRSYSFGEKQRHFGRGTSASPFD